MLSVAEEEDFGIGGHFTLTPFPILSTMNGRFATITPEYVIVGHVGIRLANLELVLVRNDHCFALSRIVANGFVFNTNPVSKIVWVKFPLVN